MISIKQLSRNGLGDSGNHRGRCKESGGGGVLQHWPLGDFTSPSLSFPIWKSGLMIAMRIQCSEVQDLQCIEQGWAHSRCSVHGSGFC